MLPKKIGGGHKLQTYNEKNAEYDDRNGQAQEEQKKQPTTPQGYNSRDNFKNLTEKVETSPIKKLWDGSQNGANEIKSIFIGKWEKGSVSDNLFKWAKKNNLDTGYTKHFERTVKVGKNTYKLADYKVENDNIYIDFKKV